MMDWSFDPGESEQARPTDNPSKKSVEALHRLVGDLHLPLRDFARANSVIWTGLRGLVTSGHLDAADVDALCRDHDGDRSIPLARRFLEAGNAVAVTGWMKDQAAFWDYNWIDRSVEGARGRGTLKLFEFLRDNGAAGEAATLALSHVQKRYTGARYHFGLQTTLKSWYKFDDPATRRAKVMDYRAQYGKPHQVEKEFAWLAYLIEQFRPFVGFGTSQEVAALDLVEKKLAREKAKFMDEIEA